MFKLTLKSINTDVIELRERVTNLEAQQRDRRSVLSRVNAKIPRLRVVWPSHREDDR